LRAERLRVPDAVGDESETVPVEAQVVEAAARTAVRIVLAVDRLRLDDVGADAEQAELVAPARERDAPPGSRPPEEHEADVARRPAACDGDGHRLPRAYSLVRAR